MMSGRRALIPVFAVFRGVVSRRIAWIAGCIVALACAAGLVFMLRLSAAHEFMHAALAGNVDRVREAIDRTPNDAGLWELLGEAHAQRSEYAHAVSAYKRSLQLDPTDETTWWMMGIAEVCQKNPAGIAAVQEALQRLNGDSAKQFAKIAPLGCCAFGGCAK